MISSLKTILEGFNDDGEIVVAITVNDNNDPVVTYDAGVGLSKFGEFMLEVEV